MVAATSRGSRLWEILARGYRPLGPRLGLLNPRSRHLCQVSARKNQAWPLPKQRSISRITPLIGRSDPNSSQCPPVTSTLRDPPPLSRAGAAMRAMVLAANMPSAAIVRFSTKGISGGQ